MAKQSKMEKPASGTPDRRKFLKSLGTGAAGAATAVLAGGAATPAEAAESAADKVKRRYKATPHVEAFYRTNRY